MIGKEVRRTSLYSCIHCPSDSSHKLAQGILKYTRGLDCLQNEAGWKIDTSGRKWNKGASETSGSSYGELM